MRAGEWRTWEPGADAGPRPPRRDRRDRGLRPDRAGGRRGGWRGSAARCCTRPQRRDAVSSELLERSDFVTLHCPLTPETRGLIDEPRRSRRMKPTAYLVNTARGPIVDTDALARGAPRGRARRRGARRDRSGAAARRITRCSMPRTSWWSRTWAPPPSPPASGWPTWPWTTCSPGWPASRCRTSRHSPSTLMIIRLGRPPSNSQ